MNSFSKKIIFFILVSITFFSCKSDENRMEDAKQVVTKFVKDFELHNWSEILNAYPSLFKSSEYWVLNNFEITDTKIENQEVTVYGKFNKDKEEKEPILFHLKENNDGKYIIDYSKGFSKFIGSYQYEFLKNGGCLNNVETDVEITFACESRINIYNYLVEHFITNLEKSINRKMEFIRFENNNGILSHLFKISNDTIVGIPSGSFRFVIMEMHREGDSMTSTGNFRFAYINGNIPVNSSQTVQFIFPSEFELSYPKFEITDKKFVEKMLSKLDTLTDSSVICSFIDEFLYMSRKQIIEKMNSKKS